MKKYILLFLEESVQFCAVLKSITIHFTNCFSDAKNSIFSLLIYSYVKYKHWCVIMIANNKLLLDLEQDMYQRCVWWAIVRQMGEKRLSCVYYEFCGFEALSTGSNTPHELVGCVYFMYGWLGQHIIPPELQHKSLSETVSLILIW